MSERSSVLIVEDDLPTRRYLSAAVAADERLVVVGECAGVAEGRVLLERHRPDVLLVDLALEDGNGMELIRAVPELSRDTLSLVITVFGDEQSVLTAIEAGAQGYLLKDATSERIGSAIVDLLAGGAPISPAIASHLLVRFRDAERAAQQEGAPADVPPATLTGREREVLELVVKGFTFPEIGELLGITAHTVTTHVRRIYRKLEVRSRSEAVYEALQQGIVVLDG